MVERRSNLLEAEDEAPDVAQNAGVPLIDVDGTPWGHVLDGVELAVLVVSALPTIEIPDGIPDVE